MNHLTKIKKILANLLDIDAEEITADTYLIRELDVESIDLLEIAVTLNSEFGVEIDDDAIFLKSLRIHLTGAEGSPLPLLLEKYPFLSKERLEEIIGDVADGPVLRVKDLVSYIEWRAAGPPPLPTASRS